MRISVAILIVPLTAKLSSYLSQAEEGTVRKMSVIRKMNEPTRIPALLACLLVAGCEVGNTLPSSCISGEQAYNSENYNRAIEDLTRCIATRGDPLTTENLATVYQLRGAAYKSTQNYSRAIEDLNEAIRLDPGFGQAYYNLGATYNESGQDKQAIQNYNKAVTLEPNVGAPLIGRGNSYLTIGEVDQAFRDYDHAIGLDPGNVKFRGNAYFLLGKFGEAAQDFRRSLERDRPEPYTSLWLYIAEVRSGQAGTDSLTRNAANLDMSEWPAPVIPLFLGESSPEQVLERARGSENQQAKMCDAFFFIGQWHLMRGDATSAGQFFQKAVATDASNQLACKFAKAERERIGT